MKYDELTDNEMQLLSKIANAVDPIEAFLAAAELICAFVNAEQPLLTEEQAGEVLEELMTQ